jgi:hypothetical protein
MQQPYVPSIWTNMDGQLSLHLMCQNAGTTVGMCKELIASNPSAVRQRDVYGRTVRVFVFSNRIPWCANTSLDNCFPI